MDNKRVPTFNLLYKMLTGLEFECLLDLNQNDFEFNKASSIIVPGYINMLYSNKQKSTPSEINQLIIQFAQLSVMKYEINVYHGSIDDKSMKNIIKSSYIVVYEENTYEKDIAFGKLNLEKLFPKSNDHGPNVITFNIATFAVRCRAILCNETKSEYSEWIPFQTTSTFVCDVGIKDSFEWMAIFDNFWSDNKLPELIDLNEWLAICKDSELNEFALKRLFYYMLRSVKFDNESNNNELTQLMKIHKRMVLWWVHIDVYRTYDHSAFTCKEWYNFRTLMQRFFFPTIVEYGRRVDDIDT